jgi:N-acetylglucosamine repressor
VIDIGYYHSDATLKKSVLQLIKEKRSVTRGELTELTGLSVTSVTKFVSSLISEGIVVERGTTESTGGRKSLLLGINPEYAYIIGVDLGGYASKIGVIRMDGSIVEDRFIENVDENVVPIKGLDFEGLCGHIQNIFSKYGKDRFMAVCVGVSGMVDHMEGRIIFCPNIAGWDNTPLAENLKNKFGVPVFVDTSARCMALAEQHLGAGSGVPDQVFISLGSFDISAAIIIDSKLFRGSCGFSGEFGHVMSSSAGVQCTCGNNDCLELVATLKVIVERIHYLIHSFKGLSPVRQFIPEDFTLGDLTPEVISRAIEAGDKQCYQAIVEAGVSVGIALSNMLNILNPRLVVLGGGVVELFPDIMMDTIRDTVRKRALITVQRGLEIKKAGLGWKGSVIGSAMQAIGKFFE